jgi:ATP dependent DNA ligase domain
MECLAVATLPTGPTWLYEVKFDGYRAIAVKSGGRPNLFSRRRNSFNGQYSLVFDALAGLPDNTVIDGEVLALNEAGRPTSISSSTTGQKPRAFITSFSTSLFTTIATSLSYRLSSAVRS